MVFALCGVYFRSMKTIIITLVFGLATLQAISQNIVGRWKCIAKLVTYEGKQLDMHAALVKSRPCTANTIYEYLAGGDFKLIITGCDEQYMNAQQKIFGKTKWKMEGGKLLTSVTKFALSNVYTVSFNGNKMTLTGESGTDIYQRVN